MSLPFDKFRRRFIALSQFDPTSPERLPQALLRRRVVLAVMPKENS
jgi:hypothetical protein